MSEMPEAKMKKFLIVITMLLASMVGYAQTPLEKAEMTTVLLSVEGFGGGWRGSGVLIDSQTVLTCAHMVQSKDDDLWVYIYPGDKVVKGIPSAGNIGKDLAFIELATPVILPSYAVFSASSTVGEPIRVIGNTGGVMHWFVTSGVVSSYEHNFILTDAVIHGGNSGGPWINGRGEVIAMTDWGIDGQNISGGISAKDALEFINNVRHPKPGMFRKDADATLTKYK
jgi:S1-C subfamily serine protease